MTGLEVVSVMSIENWQLWKRPARRMVRMSESRSVRYGMAVVLPMLAAAIIQVRPAFAESPFFVFLGAVVLSAVVGGVAPAFVTTAVSALFIRVLFVKGDHLLQYAGDLEGMERMGGFVLVALLLSSFVAEVRRERRQLRDSEERYRLLAETASDAIVVIDECGEILYVNPMAQRLFGADAENLLGQKLSRLLPGDGYQAELKEMKHRLDTRKKPVALQLPGLHKSGEHLLVEMTLGVSSHRGRDAFTAVIRDITKPR